MFSYISPGEEHQDASNASCVFAGRRNFHAKCGTLGWSVNYPSQFPTWNITDGIQTFSTLVRYSVLTVTYSDFFLSSVPHVTIIMCNCFLHFRCCTLVVVAVPFFFIRQQETPILLPMTCIESEFCQRMYILYSWETGTISMKPGNRNIMENGTTVGILVDYLEYQGYMIKLQRLTRGK